MHKTQVFNANKGDHYRNRLTHTLEVMQISRSIGRLLNLNEDLIEAISLGHDLGHTPFGHIGERTLSSLLHNGIDDISGIGEDFKHNFQSLRVIDYIEQRCDDYLGINLTMAVREGILKHTKLRNKGDDHNVYYNVDSLETTGMRLDLPFSFTLEGQVVAISDEIAQITHDIEDGIRGKVIDFEKFMVTKLVKQYMEEKDVDTPQTYNEKNQIIKGLIGYLIDDVEQASNKKIEEYLKSHENPSFVDENDVFEEICIVFSDKVADLAKQLSKDRDKWILCSKDISQADHKAEYMIKQMFKAYYRHPLELPDYVLARYYGKEMGQLDRSEINQEQLQNDRRFKRYICDHIAGMTDQFAAREYLELYQPEFY